MTITDPAIYQEIEQFYARQMRALDEGDVTDWAATFALDGVFDADGHPEPVRGRASIESGARAARDRQREEGIRNRHWLGMLDVVDHADGTVLARTYALVLSTPRGGATALRMSTSCEDVLVRDGDELLVRHRTVRRDDQPAGGRG